MGKKESPGGNRGSKQETDSPILSMPTENGARKKYRRGMGAEACRKVTRRMLGPKSEPGRASDYMQDVHECVNEHSDLEVYIIIRVSEREQKRRRNHDNYAFMEDGCGELGISVRDCIRVTCSGTITESQWRDILEDVGLRASNRAVKTGKTVAILMYSADRLLRNTLYKNTTPNLLPTRWEYRQVQRLVGDVPLLTWVDPDTPPPVVRGMQSKLGQRAKGNRGGGDRMPGQRKRRKAKLQPKARRLRRKGLTYREIKERLDVSIRTAWLWANAA